MGAANEKAAFIACRVINGERTGDIGKWLGISGPRVVQIVNLAVRKACKDVYYRYGTISHYDQQFNPPGIRFYRRYRRFFTRKLMEWASTPPV